MHDAQSRTSRSATLLFAAWLAAVPAAAGDPPAPRLSFLKAKGHDLVDESGRKVLLRGVGLGNWLLPEGYMWKFGNEGDRPRRIEKLIEDMIGPAKARVFWTRFRDDYITEQDMIRIKELGFNSVRPAFMSRLFLTEGDDPKWIDEGWKYMDRVVAWGREHGLYVIIDMHGAPGGQTGKNIDDSANDHPDLFRHPKNQDLLEQWWVKVAERYKDEPTVAGYDLLNEPLPGEFDKLGYRNELWGLYKRLTRAIRKVDTRHAIIVEGAHWANDWSTLDAPFDDNMVYQFHKYWNDIDTRSIQGYIDYRKKWNVPVWIGEIGENDVGWYWAAFQLLDDHNMGWSFWPWKKLGTDNAPYSVKEPKGWEKLVAYSHGGARPEAQEAEEILWAFLDNIRFRNCEYRADVVNALFRRVPARVEGEHFGHRGRNESYSSTDEMKPASVYRTGEPVAIRQLNEAYNVGWIDKGEWLEYEVEVENSGLFDVVFKIAAPRPGSRFRLLIDGEDATGPVEAPATTGWTHWETVTRSGVEMAKGVRKMRWISETGGHNWDWFEIRAAGAPEAPARPSNAAMKDGERGRVPGRIEAENYGPLGEGRSYHDSDAHNQGNAYRKDGVDVQLVSRSFAASLAEGQWVRYEVHHHAESAGQYEFRALASGASGAKLAVLVDGKPAVRAELSTTLAVTKTQNVTLAPGTHSVDLKAVGGEVTVDWFELTR
jgi:endoglucanase